MQTAYVLERYRRLFGSLSHLSFTLSNSDISAAQQAANTSETWQSHYLSPSSVNLRRALSHALLDSISIRHSDNPRYEPDVGIMEGDDGGYTTPASLFQDETIADPSLPCYTLLGEPASQTSSSVSSSQFESISTVLLAEKALEQLSECVHSSSTDSQVCAPLLSELQAIVTNARMRELRQPDHLANSLHALIDKQKPPAPIRQQLEASVTTARKCAQACRERTLILSQADALLTGLLSASEFKSLHTSGTNVHPPRKRPRAPIFPNPAPFPAPPASLEEILGPTHPIAKNVYCLRRFHSWRSTVVGKVMERRRNPIAKKENIISQISPRAKSPRLRVKKGRKDVVEIFNDAERTALSTPQDRYDAMTRSACALLLAHAGYSHITANAMNLLADIVEEFIMQIGSSLCTVRENVDKGLDADIQSEERGRRKTAAERIDEYKIICESGARGSILELVYYVKCDSQRVSYRVREAEKRLEHQVLNDKIGAALFQDPEEVKAIDATVRAELTNEPGPNDIKFGVKGQDAPITEEDVKLDGEPFILGYLCESVRLDVLGGITVPARVVYRKKTSNKDGIASGRIEKVQRAPRPKNKGPSLQTASTSSVPIASVSPVKAEVKLLDTGEG
ncbi:unnamed protein product [Agarophyton chilense]